MLEIRQLVIGRDDFAIDEQPVERMLPGLMGVQYAMLQMNDSIADKISKIRIRPFIERESVFFFDVSNKQQICLQVKNFVFV